MSLWTPNTKWYSTKVPGVRIIDHPSPINIRRVDMGAVPFVHQCMRNGMFLDIGEAERLQTELEEYQEEVLGQIAAMVGRPINPESSPQVGRLLFDELGLHKLMPKPPRTLKSGGFTTDDETLSSMVSLDPVVPLIQAGRELNTLLSTFVSRLPGFARRHEDHRIRTTLKITTARTGRLASEDPNLQNIPTRSMMRNPYAYYLGGSPDDGTIKAWEKESGKPYWLKWGQRIRALFKAWNKNCPAPMRNDLVYVSCDLSQIEMRLAAHLAQDSFMAAVFWGGGDIHRQTAAAIFRIAESEVTKMQRLVCKTLGFAILYGVTSDGLQGQIYSAGGPFWAREECDDLIAGWYGVYEGIRAWTDEQQYRMRRYGMTWDMFGRWRMIPEARSTIERVRAEGYRQGGNTPIQSGAQGILKLAMRIVMETLMPKWQKYGWCIPVMQIHDELLFEVWRPLAEEFAQEVRRVMGEVVTLLVPVDSSSDVAADWGSLK